MIRCEVDGEPYRGPDGVYVVDVRLEHFGDATGVTVQIPTLLGHELAAELEALAEIRAQ